MQVTKLIALDATQMGTQTCAALLGDRDTAKLVNMVASRNKADVYSKVASAMQKTIKSMKTDECPTVKMLYKKHSKEFFNRNVWKRPTMTILYGATSVTYAKHLQQDVAKATGVELTNEEAAFLGKMTEGVLKEVLPAAVLLMQSLTGIVKTVVQATNQPFVFTTATGSVFAASKYKNKNHIHIGNSAGFDLEVRVETKEMNARATAKSAAAQFIQSFDAVIAGEIQQQMADRDIPLLSVFDSWAVPQGYDDILVSVAREAYIKNLSGNPLKRFYNEARARYPLLWKHPGLFLEQGDYKIEDELHKCTHFIGL